MSTSLLARRVTECGSRVLASADPDEARDVCTSALRPHQLGLGRGARVNARLDRVSLGDLSVNRLCYGAEVRVSPAGPSREDYLLVLPVAGRAAFSYGGAEAIAEPGREVLVGPHLDFEFRIHPRFDQVIVRLDRRRVESAAAALLGEVAPIHFDLEVHQDVRRLAGLLQSAVEMADALVRPRMAWQIEQLVIESLLLTQPHNRSEALARPGSRMPSARLNQALDYLRDHLAEPFTVAGVARHCGVSVRSLQEAFRRELGTTPVQWLRAARLDRAHAMLSSAAPGTTTVTDVAYAVGFLHLGEFARHFKARFGRPPSAVLAERRA
ncbi:AraC family transcriptional regulator [Amycolatopsis circi]|uniref:AraC family transcriptional regulator n=1 Tax=Amycolatopsis circi TaxID=871959 RepID=UPI0013BEA6C5|nr:AraC family transcriptional regulator [Amycolatopsis circi]